MKRLKAKAKKGTSSGNPKKHAGGRVVFSEMKGRTVERIDVCLSSDYHCVSVRFEDKTDFTVEIDTRLVFTALHSDWKSGDMRILKRWPVIREE